MIQGIPDELTPLAEERMRKIKSMPCPRCHASMAPQLYTAQVFSKHDPLPRTIAVCPECTASIDPTTNLVLSTGDGRLVEDDPMIIKRQPRG